MATTDQKAPGFALRARIDERFFAPFKRNTFAARTWFGVALAIVVMLHAALLAAFLRRDSKPTDIAKQETPVEVIVEQKAPPPPPPPPPQQQKQQQEIEKPATSAPRKEDDTKIDTEKHDAETHAPKADAPPQDGQPKPDTAAAQDAKDDNAQDAAETAEKKPDVLEKDAEALDKAAEEQKKEPPTPAKKVVAKQKRPKPALQPFAGLSDLPDYKFAKRTKKSLVDGGTEDSRYLAIVYGLIMRQVRVVGEGMVSVAFELDDSGDVLEAHVVRSTADPIAEMEVVSAIERCSPFPPPPPNRPHGLTATIDFSRHSFTTGAR